MVSIYNILLYIAYIFIYVIIYILYWLLPVHGPYKYGAGYLREHGHPHLQTRKDMGNFTFSDDSPHENADTHIFKRERGHPRMALS